MNALQPQSPYSPPVRHLRTAPQPVQQKKRTPHRAIAIETTAKLAVNVVFSVAAVLTLIQLLPYCESQWTKLQEVKLEKLRASKRVDLLDLEFNRHFDPSQARVIMQEQSNRIGDQRQRIFFTNSAEAEGVAQTP
ncbi:MAG: hypothetical protein KME16_14350 [Scytolyngbya sp. HA4215-MV1]|nr:hypothetical protein [Scytolyngbya sp. HA4215-MV1]